MKLGVGDWIMEVNRFKPKTHYYIWQITEIKYEDNFMRLARIEAGPGNKDYYPRGCVSDISAHTSHKNCHLLTYFLPTARVLYGI